MPLVGPPQRGDEALVQSRVDAAQQEVEQRVVLLERVVLRTSDVCSLLLAERALSDELLQQTVLTLELGTEHRPAPRHTGMVT